ncbi:hypothetical protein TorRG33x02_191550 [Trema orientale]|uniref:Uncharacterized protein n=1 Tax=Trema orientale TaxID=63057 RepID=A0A2P5EHN2_TREOI|nr:hypothetical protein TorRG33x02_191550 [Trema orientale]
MRNRDVPLDMDPHIIPLSSTSIHHQLWVHGLPSTGHKLMGLFEKKNLCEKGGVRGQNGKLAFDGPKFCGRICGGGGKFLRQRALK